MLDVRDDDTVSGLRCVSDLPVRENGGFLILRQPIFDHLDGSNDLTDAIAALGPTRRVLAYKHDGFWMPADTFKERALLHLMYESGNAPWRRALTAAS